ncbi:class I SAM-dependent DNA methyltransferase [Lentilactobacillus otakiensis]|uniref:class I SAM-dependent DNA methyltransferase n=1 Tax=Lentilactobacillus otakiensis TaxID=481720 RepID=UPI003D16D69F
MDDLKEELLQIKQYKQPATLREKAKQFQFKLSKLTFFDPACGSGNFLTETYLSLRKLENEAIKLAFGDQGMLDVGQDLIKVSIQQFYGIEINDFAVSVAKTALWIAESQMMEATKAIVYANMDFLPLKTYTKIVEGNALQIDWQAVVPNYKLDYIVSNPPFIGYTQQSASQKNDLALFAGKPKNIDYVAGWYFKAAKYIHNTTIEVAYVSTNSISQGEQAALIWKPLFDGGIHINFAYSTFKWNSEATQMAHVHVVIIGFSEFDRKTKKIYSNNNFKVVSNINGYLTDADNIFVTRRTTPIDNVPQLYRGSQPTDGGNFILTSKEKNQIISQTPEIAQYIRPFMMGKDFIVRKPRYCLWLVGANPSILRKSPIVMKRIRNVEKFRLKSKKAATRRKAGNPTLFDEIHDSKTDYIAIPVVSSQARKYIPIDYLSWHIIAGNKIFMMPNASPYSFGVLTSNVHMAWMRAVGGRLKSDYSYSNTIVYNNFPWPSPTHEQKELISSTAQQILDARASYPNSSFADLYDDLAMPPELRKAHQENDKAVMQAYGMSIKNTTESDAVRELFKLYSKLTKLEQK